jgi:hypothetical protein
VPRNPTRCSKKWYLVWFFEACFTIFLQAKSGISADVSIDQRIVDENEGIDASTPQRARVQTFPVRGVEDVKARAWNLAVYFSRRQRLVTPGE